MRTKTFHHATLDTIASHEFIADPEKVLQRTDIPDPVATMAGQVEATATAALSLDRARTLQESKSILKGEDLGFLLNMLLMTHGAHITAAHRHRLLQIHAAIDREDREETSRLIAAAQTALKQADAQCKRLNAGPPKNQLMYHYTRRRTFSIKSNCNH